MSRARKEILLRSGTLEDVIYVCDLLNGTRGERVMKQLTDLITAWERSGRNLQKMMNSNFPLCPLLPDAWEAKWAPTEQGGAHIVLVPNPKIGYVRKELGGRKMQWDMNPAGEALQAFYSLTIGPWERLSNGPCPRCKRYFVLEKVTKEPQVHCSRRCARIAYSAKWNEARRNRVHQENIKRTQNQILKFEHLTRRPSEKWEQWVSDRLLDSYVDVKMNGKVIELALPAITAYFITHAVNNGELTPPRALLWKG